MQVVASFLGANGRARKQLLVKCLSKWRPLAFLSPGAWRPVGPAWEPRRQEGQPQAVALRRGAARVARGVSHTCTCLPLSWILIRPPSGPENLEDALGSFSSLPPRSCPPEGWVPHRHCTQPNPSCQTRASSTSRGKPFFTLENIQVRCVSQVWEPIVTLSSHLLCSISEPLKRFRVFQ